MFSSAANGGDPATPLLQSYVGDPVRVHVIGAPGNEQTHSFSLGGFSWPIDPLIPRADSVEARAIAPMGSLDAQISLGADRKLFAGDYFYGDLRRPFTVAGMWGLQRVLDRGTCKLKKLDGTACVAGVG